MRFRQASDDEDNANNDAVAMVIKSRRPRDQSVLPTASIGLHVILAAHSVQLSTPVNRRPRIGPDPTVIRMEDIVAGCYLGEMDMRT